jgi:AraC-like DNA-binding protein
MPKANASASARRDLPGPQSSPGAALKAMELRQPLQVIVTAREVLAQTVRGAAEEAQLTLIKDATARLATLLDRLVLKLREPAAMRSRPTRATAPGGLAPSQTVRAEAFLTAHFAEDVTLNDVAAQCRLSPAQFARAFAQTTGMLPNEWLLRYRIDEAKAMMLAASWRKVRDMHSRTRSAVTDVRIARASLGKYTRMILPQLHAGHCGHDNRQG